MTPTANGSANRRAQLPEEVAAYVREQIISGTVKPGDFLRMEPIAEAMGVSNTPVREGLFSLRSEGLVELVPRRGFVVAKLVKQDIRDLYWVQAKLAGELAARAAKSATKEDIAELEELVHRYEDVTAKGDEDDVADVGHLFHRKINLMSGSDRLARLLGSIVRQLPNTFYAAIDGQVDATRREHPAILDAIKSGDVRESRKRMEKHLSDEAHRLIDLLSQRGIWSDESDSVAS